MENPPSLSSKPRGRRINPIIWDRARLEAALRANGWNVAKTAEDLGVHLTTAYQWIRNHGLKRAENSLPAVVAAAPSLTRMSANPVVARREAHLSLQKQQNGKCAICRQPETMQGEGGEPLPLSLYANGHNQWVIKALLCKACSTGLSMFRESPVFLARAIELITQKPPAGRVEARVSDL